jgi:hypothetical protein
MAARNVVAMLSKSQGRALKICHVGKFSEGAGLQGWKKTKVEEG